MFPEQFWEGVMFLHTSSTSLGSNSMMHFHDLWPPYWCSKNWVRGAISTVVSSPDPWGRDYKYEGSKVHRHVLTMLGLSILLQIWLQQDCYYVYTHPSDKDPVQFGSVYFLGASTNSQCNVLTAYVFPCRDVKVGGFFWVVLHFQFFLHCTSHTGQSY